MPGGGSSRPGGARWTSPAESWPPWAKIKPSIDRACLELFKVAHPKIVQGVAEHNRTAVFPEEPRLPCFELLGIDFLVDEDHRSWLLEVNESPNLRDHGADVLEPMLASLLDIVLADAQREHGGGSLSGGDGGGDGGGDAAGDTGVAWRRIT